MNGIMIDWYIEQTDNPDGICDDCKFCIIDNKDIPPNL